MTRSLFSPAARNYGWLGLIVSTLILVSAIISQGNPLVNTFHKYANQFINDPNTKEYLKRIETLEFQVAELKQTESKYNKIRGILKMPRHRNNLLVANVDTYYHLAQGNISRFIIDSDLARANTVLCSGSIYLGRVIGNQSDGYQAITIYDKDSTIPVKINGKYQTLVSGYSNSSAISGNIPESAVIKVGDLVFTQASPLTLDGLKVGYVKEILYDLPHKTKKLIIEAAANYSQVYIAQVYSTARSSRRS